MPARAAVEIPAGGVKICGLREPEHAFAAAEAGADLIGFIFAATRRYVTPATAARCIKAARVGGRSRPLAVGVFVNAGSTEINTIATEAGLDLVQLHGDERPELVSEIELPVIRVLRPPAGATLADVRPQPAPIGSEPVAYLLDGHSDTAYGGAGIRSDWTLAANLAPVVPLILAGGLNPENVGEAIETVGPRAVDVSSGVETDGVKDPKRIVAFVEAAKAAFAARLGPAYD